MNRAHARIHIVDAQYKESHFTLDISPWLMRKVDDAKRLSLLLPDDH